MTPLTDRQGRFSPLKATTLMLALLPAAVIAYWYFTHQLGPLAVKAALRLIGDWTIRLLVITLALTPLQRVLNWPKIALIRRMLHLSYTRRDLPQQLVQLDHLTQGLYDRMSPVHRYLMEIEPVGEGGVLRQPKRDHKGWWN